MALESIYSKGGIVVHYDTNSREAYTTDRGKVPSLDEIARERAYARYMASCDDLSDWRDDHAL